MAHIIYEIYSTLLIPICPICCLFRSQIDVLLSPV